MIQVNCDWCCKEFVPTPDSFVETGFATFSEEGDEWQGPQGGANFSEEQKAEMREVMQLDDEQLTHLLKEGEIATQVFCLCPACLEPEDEES